MLKRTKQEVEEEVKRIWAKDFEGYRETKILIEKCGDGWDITLKRMYEYIPVNLKHLKALSEFFDTDNINDSRYSYGGCETCDYGSSYEITLTVEP